MVWQLLIYRLPANPSRARVAVWRDLRRLGALPLQQSVAAVPELDDLGERLDAIESRIGAEGGSSYRFRLDGLTPEQERGLESEWNDLRSQEFAEIVEECEAKFEREVEFEIYRGNFTAAEAEELEADLDKIKSWFERVRGRDLFEAPTRREAEAAIERCERALESFVDRVYLAEAAQGPLLDAPIDLPWGTGVPATKEERERVAGERGSLPPGASGKKRPRPKKSGPPAS